MVKGILLQAERYAFALLKVSFENVTEDLSPDETGFFRRFEVVFCLLCMLLLCSEGCQ